MLVLSRKVGEKIVIADQITITIQRISGNRVSLGIDAPRDVHVARSELKPLVCVEADTEAPEAETDAPARSRAAEVRVPSDEGFQMASRVDAAAAVAHKSRRKPLPR